MPDEKMIEDEVAYLKAKLEVLQKAVRLASKQLTRAELDLAQAQKEYFATLLDYTTFYNKYSSHLS